MTLEIQTLDTGSRSRQKRQVTEASIIDAFETVLERDGVHAVGVNAVVKEARIGKGLLYKYFGGLPGLVKVWAQRRQIWPNIAALLKSAKDDPVEPLEPIKDILTTHASALRDRPIALEVLAEELLRPSALSGALTEARQQYCDEHFEALSKVQEFQSPTNRSVGLILFAAANYLAMRSRSSPSYMGLQLDTDEGWDHVIAAMEEIVDRAGDTMKHGDSMGASGQSDTQN